MRWDSVAHLGVPHLTKDFIGGWVKVLTKALIQKSPSLKPVNYLGPDLSPFISRNLVVATSEGIHLN